MGYPVYKLIRAVNRQYPNNGFIDYVDVREDMTDGIIDEDLRDLINEAIHETYIDIARDEVFSFPTVPGQNQYVLPDDCDLRDIQEVTRTFGGGPRPFPPPPPGPEPEPMTLKIGFDPNGGVGSMPDMWAKEGSTIILPNCEFTPPVGTMFSKWRDNEGLYYEPNQEYEVYMNTIFKAIWIDEGDEEELKAIASMNLEEDLEISTGEATIGVEGHKTVVFPNTDTDLAGSGLTAGDDNKIEVGNGINYVKISANIYFKTVDTDYSTYNNERYLNIYVSDSHGTKSNISRTIKAFADDKNPLNGSHIPPCAYISNIVVPVEYGDTIEVRITGLENDVLYGGGDTYCRNVVTIEGIYLS